MARPAFKTASESWPRQGNRELPVLLDFTATGVINDDLSPEMQASNIETIQAVYIDNSLNSSALSLTFYPSGQNIQAQPYTQGIYPVICWGRINYKAITSQGIRVLVIFSNTPPTSFAAWGPVPGVNVVPALINQPINLAPSAVGDNLIIPGVAGEQIRVYRMLLSFSGNTTITFYSGSSAGAMLFGPSVMFAGGSITMEPSGVPWLVCAVGQGLDLNTTIAVNVGGMISYTQS